MSKTTVTRLFLTGLITVVAGGVLALIAGGFAYTNGVFQTAGADVVGVNASPLAWVLLGLGVTGGLAIAAGVILGFVAWIGALLNTAQIDSKAWFLALLLLGIFNLGFLAMIAYVIAGPDGTAPAASQRARVPASV